MWRQEEQAGQAPSLLVGVFAGDSGVQLYIQFASPGTQIFPGEKFGLCSGNGQWMPVKGSPGIPACVGLCAKGSDDVEARFPAARGENGDNPDLLEAAGQMHGCTPHPSRNLY